MHWLFCSLILMATGTFALETPSSGSKQHSQAAFLQSLCANPTKSKQFRSLRSKQNNLQGSLDGSGMRSAMMNRLRNRKQFYSSRSCMSNLYCIRPHSGCFRSCAFFVSLLCSSACLHSDQEFLFASLGLRFGLLLLEASHARFVVSLLACSTETTGCLPICLRPHVGRRETSTELLIENCRSVKNAGHSSASGRVLQFQSRRSKIE